MPLLGKLPPIQTTGRLRGGLLSGARPLPATFDQWRQGINFNSDCGAGVSYDTRCVTSPLDTNAAEKTIATVGDVIEMAPFTMYSGSECSTWMDQDELLALARSGFARGESRAFALELQSNASGEGPNISLNSEATDITPGGGPSDVTNTLSGLTSVVCDCTMNDLYLHSHVRAIPFLMERDLIEWDPQSGHYRHGPYPFLFDCYDAEGPGAVSEPVDGSAVWIYATGPIEIAVSEEADTSHAPAVRTNQDLALVERLGILRFDPCCVYAALAELF